MATEQGYGTGWCPDKLAVVLNAAKIVVSGRKMHWYTVDKMSTLGFNVSNLPSADTNILVRCTDTLQPLDLERRVRTPTVIQLFRDTIVRNGHVITWQPDMVAAVSRLCPEAFASWAPTSDQRRGAARVVLALKRVATACNENTDAVEHVYQARVTARMKEMTRSINASVQASVSMTGDVHAGAMHQAARDNNGY